MAAHLSFDREAVANALREAGTIAGAARILNVERRRLSEYVNGDDGLSALKGSRPAAPETAGLTMNEDGSAVFVSTASERVGSLEEMLQSEGMDPEEWVIISRTVNAWEALAGTNDEGEPIVVTLKQRKATLRPRLTMAPLAPAVYVPPLTVDDMPPMRISVHEPDLIVVEGDHQVPYVHRGLHRASLRFLNEMRPKEQVFLGDTGDFPTISRHPDHPAAMAPVQAVIQATAELLRDKAQASPGTIRKKLKGNHDWRIESEQLLRSERMHGIKPAQLGDDEELPALSLRRLLHLDTLGIELVEDPRGWEHAEVEIVPGKHGLVVRHGWLTGDNTAARSMKKRGQSLIVGHTHDREHTFMWEPFTQTERQAVVAGCMCLVRDQRFPHFAVLDKWLQGFTAVWRWPDGRFEVSHARWENDELSWGNRRWGD